mmetsp:Transcript_33038/g.40891  ORF Transcript_33038/g.40891 Transcript_33038/m.40891 type:complete len:110 (+) Transcript_33038:1415-1744(+)
MSVLTTSILFNYLLLKYLTNTVEQVYASALIGAISEFVSYAISGYAFEKFGLKATFVVSMAVTTIGATLVLRIGLKDQGSALFPVFFLLINSGLCCAYNITVLSNSTLF